MHEGAPCLPIHDNIKRWVKLKKNIVISSKTMHRCKITCGLWNIQDIVKKNLPTWVRNNGMAYMLYHHTRSIGCVYLIRAGIILHHREFIQVTTDVVHGCAIGVLGRIKVVGGRRRHNILRLLKARVILVKTFPTMKRRVPKLVADLTLMVLVGIVRVTHAATTRMTATITVPLKTPMRLLLGDTTMHSSVGEHVILLLLLLLRFLRDEAHFSIKEARVECLRTDRLGRAIDLLNQGIVVCIEAI
jgi:hypothetical protein